MVSYFTNDLGVSDFIASIAWDVVDVNDIKRSRFLGPLAERSFLSCTNTLTQTPEFVGVGLISDFYILGACGVGHIPIFSPFLRPILTWPNPVKQCVGTAIEPRCTV